MITSGGTFPLEVLYAVKLQCPLYTLKTTKTTNKYMIGIFLILLLSYNTKELGSVNARRRVLIGWKLHSDWLEIT